MTIKFQTYYNRNHVDKGTEFDPNSSLTDQSFKMHTDIDYLLSHMAGHSRTPLYGVQETMTFEDWNNEMALVKRRFLELDPVTRAHFGNAQKFLEWCADPNNYAEMLPSSVSKKAMEEDDKARQQRQEDKEDRQAKKIAKAIKGE